jgi:hypothetical protein
MACSIKNALIFHPIFRVKILKQNFFAKILGDSIDRNAIFG